MKKAASPTAKANGTKPQRPRPSIAMATNTQPNAIADFDQRQRLAGLTAPLEVAALAGHGIAHVQGGAGRRAGDAVHGQHEADPDIEPNRDGKRHRHHDGGGQERGLELGAQDVGTAHRRRGDKVGRFFGRIGEPGERAGKIAGEKHDHQPRNPHPEVRLPHQEDDRQHHHNLLGDLRDQPGIAADQQPFLAAQDREGAAARREPGRRARFRRHGGDSGGRDRAGDQAVGQFPGGKKKQTGAERGGDEEWQRFAQCRPRRQPHPAVLGGDGI